MKRSLVYCILILTLLTVEGCVPLIIGASSGGATAFWLQGKLVQGFETSWEKAVQAVDNAIIQEGLIITKKVVKDNSIQYRGTYTDERALWIDLIKVNPQWVEVQIRIGIKGDKQAARGIITTIRNNLYQ